MKYRKRETMINYIKFIKRYSRYKSKVYRQDLINEAYRLQWERIKGLPGNVIRLIQDRDVYLNRLERENK